MTYYDDWMWRRSPVQVGPSDKFFNALNANAAQQDVRSPLADEMMMNTTLSPEKAERHTLYIVMRTDMDSMNPGKAMAQAAHAGQLAENTLMEWDDGKNNFNEECGFMTTIVLEGSIDDVMSSYKDCIEGGLYAGLVEDPTYPIKDGWVTHHVPVVTCCWCFVDKGNVIPPLLKKLYLHR